MTYYGAELVSEAEQGKCSLLQNERYKKITTLPEEQQLLVRIGDHEH